MMWIVILVIGIGLWLLLRRKPTEQVAAGAQPQSDAVALPAAWAKPQEELAEEELLAVLAAAIAEYEGTSEFQVVSIRLRNQNWSLIGRQEQLFRRL